MKRYSTALAALASLILAACLGNSGDPQPPPQNVQAVAGDGAITVFWDPVAGDTYWLFYALSPDLAIDSNNWTSLLGAGALVGVTSPVTLCGLLNNPYPTAYYPDMFFSVNARSGTAAGGAGSALVSAAPRGAGSAAAPWIAGNSVASAVNAISYAAISPCGYSGRPASGRLVAVGPSGTIAWADLIPDLAGRSPRRAWATRTRPGQMPTFPTDLAKTCSRWPRTPTAPSIPALPR